MSLKISAREIDKIKLDKQLGIVFKSLNPQAGSEDRLMFGSDNADIATSIASVNALNFLTTTRKEKLFYLNA
ncbi:MAG: hypothetical protein H0U27_07780, partial [Nitrosopumilus sp.]|nr:hypothetical protein [Nitrosopumilus sp.]